jgi:hypothetical protein
LFEPDVRSGFLLEAKQYADGAAIPGALRAAFRQALDTASNLPGSGYAVEEAFIVLFRRNGARAILPSEPVVADGLRWYVRIINIARPDDDASRNRRTPVEYGIDELRQLLVSAADQSGL